MQLHQLPDPGMVNNLVADPLYPHKSTPFTPPPRAHLRDAELMVTYERSQQGGDALVVDLGGGGREGGGSIREEPRWLWT